jgi:hypothetical protein
MVAPRLSDAQKQELLGRFQDGENTQVLADHYGCSANTVTRIVKGLLTPSAYEDLKRSRLRRNGGTVVAAAHESELTLLQPELSLGGAPTTADTTAGDAFPADALAEPEADRRLPVSQALNREHGAPPVGSGAEAGTIGTAAAAPTTTLAVGWAAPSAQGSGGSFWRDDAPGQSQADGHDAERHPSSGDTDRGSDEHDEMSERDRDKWSVAEPTQSRDSGSGDIHSKDYADHYFAISDPSFVGPGGSDCERDGSDRGGFNTSPRHASVLVDEDLDADLVGLQTDDFDQEDLDDEDPEDDDLDDDAEESEAEDGDEADLLGLRPHAVDLAARPVCVVIPWSGANIPDSGYLLVDKTVELQALPLSEIPDLGTLAPEEQQRQALVVYTNPRQAKRLCGRSQRVIKLPDTQVLARTAPYLLAQGISRIVIEGSLYSLPER